MDSDQTRDVVSKWDSFLSEASLWPAQAAEWDTVSSFVDQLQAVAAQKQSEHESWRVLQQAIERLIQNCSEEELTLFGFHNSADWSVEEVATERERSARKSGPFALGLKGRTRVTS